jgi:hypothetical protein
MSSARTFGAKVKKLRQIAGATDAKRVNTFGIMINGIERDFRDEFDSLAQPIAAVDVLPIGRSRPRTLNRALRYGVESGKVLRIPGTEA